MHFRDRLLVIGLILVLVPAGLVTAIYSYLMATSLTADAGMIVRTKLDLLENRIATSHDVLERAGIASNNFYAGTALSAIAKGFAQTMDSGDSFLIIDGEGTIREGSGGTKGTALDPADPLRRVLPGKGNPGAGPPPGTKAGPVKVVGSPALESSGVVSIVALRSYEPWDLTLVVAANEAHAFAPLEAAMRLAVGLSFILLGLAGAVIFILARRMSLPLVRLASFAQALGEGERGLSLPARGNDEIGVLAYRFNEMARKMDMLMTGLEARVAERTVELSAANRRLHDVNDDLASTLERVERMREQLVESEKLVALGQLVAGIAHELNTPLGAISMSGQSLAGILAGLPEHLASLAALSAPERKTILDNCIQPRKAAGRAERAALASRLEILLEERGVARPAEAADLLAESGCDESILPERIEGEKLAALAFAIYELSGLGRSSAVIAAASEQAVRVIEALRTYARQDGKQALVPIDILDNIEQVLMLFSSKIKLGVEVQRHLEPLPLVMGSAEKLAQVWTNLISNALQAMDYRGRLTISSSRDGPLVIIEIGDTGSGIPPDIRDHIFTPFFTTKPPGEGTGLGLEISRRIVEDLGGDISFQSVPGHTVFRVSLPATVTSAEAPRP